MKTLILVGFSFAVSFYAGQAFACNGSTTDRNNTSRNAKTKVSAEKTVLSALNTTSSSKQIGSARKVR